MVRKKLLFLEWKSFGNDFVAAAFEKNGIEVDKIEFPRDKVDTRKDATYTKELVSRLLTGGYAAVFTFNYFPIVAMACKACKVKYLSWVYDSPFIQLYSQTIDYETNYIFVLDKGTCNDLWNKGINTVYYLPMAASVSFYNQVTADISKGMRYRSDVSFIGSMYSEEKQHMYRHLVDADEYTKGYLEALMQAQKRLYGVNILEQSLTPDIMEKVRKVCPITAQGDGFETVEWTFANYFLARKVTAMERWDIMAILNKMAKEQKLQVKLYTPEKTPDFSNIKNMGQVDYYDGAPFVFKNSKINLNISLKSILTGMPLRVFDIMGCGGFLLSNFQADFLDYFVPGEDFVYYEDMQDMKEKIEYYLEHEAEQKEIAANGHRKVAAEHTYEKRIAAMLDIAAL